MTAITDLPCAICNNPLEAMDGNPKIPYGANIFSSSGHYGSTVYDPPGGEHIEILICAECLKAMVESRIVARVLHGTTKSPEQRHAFNSDEDPVGDNPKNQLRLNNEFAMERYCESQSGMTEKWTHKIYEACMEASKEGREFYPADIPSS